MKRNYPDRKVGEVYSPYRLWVGMFIPNWLAQRTEISGEAKIVFARLCQYAGENGRAFPKVETLAKEIGKSKRSTQRYLAELREHKLIDVQEMSSKHMASNYIFLWHEWIDQKETDIPPAKEEAEEGGAGEGPVSIYPVVSPVPCQPCHPSHDNSGTSYLRESEEETQTNSAGTFGSAKSQPSFTGKTQHPASPEEKKQSPRKAEVDGPSGRGKPKHWEAPAKNPQPKSKALLSGSASVQADDPVTSSESESNTAADQSAAVDSSVSKRKDKLSDIEAAIVEAARTKARADAQAAADASSKKENKLRNLKGAPQPEKYMQMMSRFEREWRDHMAATFPQVEHGKWDAKERGILKHLVEKYGPELVSLAIQYLITQFASITKRVFRGKAAVPSLKLLSGLHETIFAEAQLFKDVAEAKKAIDDWKKANPGVMVTPYKLQQRYKEALQKSGLEG